MPAMSHPLAGAVLSQRRLNPALAALCGPVRVSQEDADEEREFRFEQLIILAPFSKVEADEAAGAGSSSSSSSLQQPPAKKTKTPSGAQAVPGAVIYKKIADEFLIAVPSA